ncbi:MAG: hypothetical protein HRT71_09290 [Flavobacteriales bacterium]|nr:hypothetical protein [Flavobacteriales bacterium]
MHKFILLITFLFLTSIGIAQTVYSPLSNESLYGFLDELANLKIIDLNSAVKPYSRLEIATKLKQAKDSSAVLNKRQVAEVDFYLKDFNKELLPGKFDGKRKDVFYYKDSLFSITVNPILGVQIWNNDSGLALHRWNGGEMFGSIGKRFGFYANLTDNYEMNMVGNEMYRNQRLGGNYKSFTDNSAEFSEMKGGLTYTWKWGNIGLIKDHFTWGNSYHGANILSGRTPSFAHIKLNVKPVKWLEFNYIHGSLVSEVRDSSSSYFSGVNDRKLLVGKYLAANLLTIEPIKGLKVSVGNSIVYSDRLQVAYFIPFFFFKSVDHTLNYGTGNYGGQNAQMFLDISSRQIRGVHLFTTLFVDEISKKRMFIDSTHSNFVSFKAGAAWSNVFNSNATLIAEYTRTNPVTYRHFVNTTTFESNGYNLGHYLRDNAQELAFMVRYKPIKNLRIVVQYVMAEAGELYGYTGTNRDGWGLPFIDAAKWKSDRIRLKASYEIINDIRVFGSYQYSNVSGDYSSLYTMPYYQGKQSTVSFGVVVGI